MPMHILSMCQSFLHSLSSSKFTQQIKRKKKKKQKRWGGNKNRHHLDAIMNRIYCTTSQSSKWTAGLRAQSIICLLLVMMVIAINGLVIVISRKATRLQQTVFFNVFCEHFCFCFFHKWAEKEKFWPNDCSSWASPVLISSKAYRSRSV